MGFRYFFVYCNVIKNKQMEALKKGKGNHDFSNFVQFRGTELPDEAIEALTTTQPGTNWESTPFRYPGEWHLAYHEKGVPPEKSKKWILVTNNAGFYKVDAEYAIWYTAEPNEISGSTRMRCYWSWNQAITNLNRLLRAGSMERDPNYQT